MRTSKRKLDGQMYKELVQGKGLGEKQEERKHLTAWAQSQEGPLEGHDGVGAVRGIWP